jgi:hypothetical protein
VLEPLPSKFEALSSNLSGGGKEREKGAELCILCPVPGVQLRKG